LRRLEERPGFSDESAMNNPGQEFVLVLALLGIFGGFASGLLGFGGGVVMFPLLFYVPPLLGFQRIDAKTVAALVISQVVFSTIVGGLAHLRSRRVQWRLGLTAGGISAIGSLIGGAASKWLSEFFLLLVFGVVTLVVASMMFLPAPPEARENLAVEDVTVTFAPLAFLSVVAGLVVGLLGAGNFIFVPVLIYMLRVPTRIAIATSLLIALMNTFFGFMGKLVTDQIPLVPALAVVVGAAVGALLGEKIHSRIASSALRYIYAVIIVVITLRIWITLFQS
jgi:uncharacterized membrane protein YfcA